MLGAKSSGLHLVVRMQKDGEGYYGVLDSVDQGAKLPIERASFDQNKVRFEVKAVEGVFEGTLDKSATVLNGTWTQKGVPAQPLSLERDKNAIASATRDDNKSVKKVDGKPFLIPLLASVSNPPNAVNTNGKSYLVYEINLANMGKSDCSIEALDVLSKDGSQTLASLKGRNLAKMFREGKDADRAPNIIGAAENGLIFVWVESDASVDKLPDSLKNKLSIKVGTYPEPLELSMLPVKVDKSAIQTLGNPFPAGEWSALNGPGNDSVHRRAVVPLEGKPFIGQRFAIDWVQYYPDGKTYKGDPKDNRSYKCYGQDLLAVADGTVCRIKDGIKENVPGPVRAVPITLETLCGNHVVLDIGGGHYAFYAHMQPGSQTVKFGDKVKKGQVLGKLGNTGNSDEPHLHLHICNGPDPVGSDGIPYFFNYDRKDGSKTSTVTGMPLQNDVVLFK